MSKKVPKAKLKKRLQELLEQGKTSILWSEIIDILAGE